MTGRHRGRVGLALLALTLLAAWAGFGFARGGAMAPADSHDDVAWMQREFALSAAQMDEIERMHTAYRSVCDEHCRMIREGRAEVASLRAANADATEVARAERILAKHDAHCRSDLRDFLTRVAGAMGDEAGARYLALVEPRLAKFDHEGAPDLNWSAPHQHDADPTSD
ncbi:hypothetical protein [Actomonas aquatica]|uniref:Periplasmic heavy metal sensor n=1 Tax=Actomonas aquatica TaxID=2866162 RepID=A0ABZ1CD52_9BACT|nr:hypothetical protein [Opitutus sp. WL0086]WRQ89608.1 hypothetical protein K1X11_009320 [Opitutus sp. WL0086]